MRKDVKMADEFEDESVGDSSARRLLGVRRAVRELMREALHSEKNEELLTDLVQSAPLDTASLLQEKERLLQEKRACEVELELRRRLSENPLSDSTVTLEDLEERVAELEKEVTTAKSHFSQDKQLIHRLQQSEILINHLFRRPDPTTEDKALKAAVCEQCELSDKVGRVCEEVQGEERELVSVKRERLECQRQCRELVAKVEILRSESVDEREGTEEMARLQAKLAAKTTECKLLRACLQGLIVGSGVDWAETEQLRDLTISLGHPFPWEQH